MELAARRRSVYGILCHSALRPTTRHREDRCRPECCGADGASRKKLIEALVGSGRYQNASEVLRDGLRLVERREAEDAAKLEALREAAGLGAAALDRGDFKEFENIEDLQTYLNKLSEMVISGATE